MSTSANLRSIYCCTITVFDLKDKTDHRRKRFTLMSAIVTHATTWESNAYTALWTAFWMISQQYAYTVICQARSVCVHILMHKYVSGFLQCAISVS